MTWFFDTPSPDTPFSVHRMAPAGKELGKDVRQWFGPSTAARAIKYVYLILAIQLQFYSHKNIRTLVHAFPKALLGVSVGTCLIALGELQDEILDPGQSLAIYYMNPSIYTVEYNIHSLGKLGYKHNTKISNQTKYPA